MEWEAEQSLERIAVPKGHSMTQKYYVERLIPVYIKGIEDLRAQSDGNWILQKGNDPSHGTRKKGLTQVLKEERHIHILVHPSQSPGLSPIEAC